MRTISILGCGWLGRPLGEALIQDGMRVLGSTTSHDKIADFARAGIEGVVLKYDPEVSGQVGDFFDSDVLVISIPPRSRQNTGEMYMSQITNVAACVAQNTVRKIVFISSTSVYPDNNRIVTEDDADETSLLRRAEKIVQSCPDVQSVILRFGGLVGPGRHPGRFLSGRETGGRDNPVNMIHLDDCIGVIRSVLGSGQWNEVYNACADLHPARELFYSHACSSAGLPAPVFRDDMLLDFKIISSEKLKRQLPYVFRFPDPMKMTY